MRASFTPRALIALGLMIGTAVGCGDDSPGAGEGDSEFSALEGSWTRTHASGHYRYTFTTVDAEQVFLNESFEAGSTTPVNSSAGSVSALNGFLALWTACDLSTGTPGSQEVGPYAIHSDGFSREQVYLPASAEQGIVGMWSFAWERYVDLDCAGYPENPTKTRTDVLELREDGTCRFTSNEMTTTSSGSFVPIGEAVDREGTWTLEEEGGVQKVTTSDAQAVKEYALTAAGALVDLNPSHWYLRD